MQIPKTALPEVLEAFAGKGCHISRRSSSYRVEIPGWELLGQHLGLSSMMTAPRLFWDELELRHSARSNWIRIRWRYWRAETFLLHGTIGWLLFPYRSSEPRFVFAAIFSQLLPLAMSAMIWRDCREIALKAAQKSETRS